jgi:hypothetical protein
LGGNGVPSNISLCAYFCKSRNHASSSLLLDNISRSSHKKAKASSKTESHTDLIQDVKVLFKKNWPSEINIRCGEESVSNLCELF